MGKDSNNRKREWFLRVNTVWNDFCVRVTDQNNRNVGYGEMEFVLIKLLWWFVLAGLLEGKSNVEKIPLKSVNWQDRNWGKSNLVTWQHYYIQKIGKNKLILPQKSRDVNYILNKQKLFFDSCHVTLIIRHTCQNRPSKAVNTSFFTVKTTKRF